MGDFDYREIKGEDINERRNEVPVPPISPLIAHNHIDCLAENLFNVL